MKSIFFIGAATALPDLKIPTPNNIRNFGEHKPQLTQGDTIQAGLVSTFTDSFFQTYNSQFIDSFTEKMQKLDMTAEFCDTKTFGNIGVVNLCVDKQKLTDFSIARDPSSFSINHENNRL